MRAATLVPLAAVFAFACRSHASNDEYSIQSAANARNFSEQVNVGQGLYAKNCSECHGASGEGRKAPALVGLKTGALPAEPPPTRRYRKTRFITVADVGDFVVHNMPPNKVGTLTEDEYWAILAFDLHANGVDLDSKLTPELARSTAIPR